MGSITIELFKNKHMKEKKNETFNGNNVHPGRMAAEKWRAENSADLPEHDL